jgi:hypothetical protein
MDDGTDGFTFVHQIKRFVDLLQRQTVGNERIELNFSAMASSTIPGSWVRPFTPPNAEPRHTRPVTSWNGRVLIS